MSDIQIIAAGKIKKGPLLDLWHEYSKRMQNAPVLHEIDDQNPKSLEQKMSDLLDPKGVVIAMDEKGQELGSMAFAKMLEDFDIQSIKPVQFFIGAADGLPQIIRDNASRKLAFGKQTWPHKLVRIMLLEQLYRAEKIIQGHPYHREG